MKTHTALRSDLDAQSGRLTQIDVTEPTQTEKNLERRRSQRANPRSPEERQAQAKRRIPLPKPGASGQ